MIRGARQALAEIRRVERAGQRDAAAAGVANQRRSLLPHLDATDSTVLRRDGRKLGGRRGLEAVYWRDEAVSCRAGRAVGRATYGSCCGLLLWQSMRSYAWRRQRCRNRQRQRRCDKLERGGG